jgi:uncharacterized protein YgbK (DUF1537 family)
MQRLRLLADDLTGALDTAAEFVGRFGSLDVRWSAGAVAAAQDSLVIDSGTREATPDQALAIVQELAPLLQGGGIAFKKVDSLMRGPWAAELDACLRAGFWDACIVAPAFPHQGRRTRDGQQYVQAADGGWRAAGGNIIAELRAQGIEARPGRLDAELAAGVSVFDAGTDQDLADIAEIGNRYSGRLLWCGSGGLAGALAGRHDAEGSRILKMPVLGVFGSDHPATTAQLAKCESVTVSAESGWLDLDQVRRGLDHGVAFVRLQAPHGSSRQEAAQLFAAEIAQLARAIERPGTLIAAGGETLKAQCLAVGAAGLKVMGRLEPGIPRSVIQGGGWAGVDVISKSGAFGPPDLWRKLLDDNRLI